MYTVQYVIHGLSSSTSPFVLEDLVGGPGVGGDALLLEGGHGGHGGGEDCRQAKEGEEAVGGWHVDCPDDDSVLNSVGTWALHS